MFGDDLEKGQGAVYLPTRRDDILFSFKAFALEELPKFRWSLFNQAAKAGDYSGALDIAARALDEEAARYAAMKSFRRGSVHVTASNSTCLYLASIFGRFDVIDKVVAIEKFALDEAKRPYEPSPHDRGETERASYEKNAAYATEVHIERMAKALEHKTDHERFTAILNAVRERPGVLQMDLPRVVPGRDTKAVTRMVDQLEAAGLMETKKVGSRIGAWPANHPAGPAASERREPRWYWSWADYREGPTPAEWLDPAGTIANIESLMALVEEAAGRPETDEGLRPTILDFLDGGFFEVVPPRLSGGNAVLSESQQLAMAIMGHTDLAEAAAMAERVIQDKGAMITTNQKRKWLSAEPRHTHMERMPFTERFRPGSTGWLLREVPEPTADSVPVTSFTASGAVTDPDKAAELGAACWLKRTKARR
jgi:hypothetical protein